MIMYRSLGRFSTNWNATCVITLGAFFDCGDTMRRIGPSPARMDIGLRMDPLPAVFPGSRVNMSREMFPV